MAARCWVCGKQIDLYGYDDEYCTYCGNTVWEDPGVWEDYYERSDECVIIDVNLELLPKKSAIMK